MSKAALGGVTIDAGLIDGSITKLDANGTTLTVDAIVDGEFLKRVGATVVSAAVSGGSGLTQPQVMARSFCGC